MKLHNEDWQSHLPWIKQWVSMRRALGASCLNCEWDFHVGSGKTWGVLRKPCAEHAHLTEVPPVHGETVQ